MENKMKNNKTKLGIEFENALTIVKARIEKQLRVNGKLETGDTFDVEIKRPGHKYPISVTVWNGDEVVEFYTFLKNGELAF